MYYAFDFPKLRNDIAHGNMIDVNEECAFDLLMDISYLIQKIDAEDMNYKIVLDFFVKLNETENKVEYILEYFSSDIYYERNTKWLNEYILGKYNELIKWYKYGKAEKNFIKVLKSKQFRDNIFNGEPLITHELVMFGEKEIRKENINTNVLKFLPILNILKKKYTFPDKWMSEIDKRIKDIEKEENKQKEKFEIYYELLVK